MAWIPIETLDDPRLDVYRALKATNLTRWSGRFVAEGRRVVERLIDSPYAVESVLVSDRLADNLAPHVPPETPLLVIPQEMAEQLVGYNFHAGVLACGRRRTAPTLEQIAGRNDTRFTLVVCPHVTGPENLGTMIRLCAGLGVDALLLGHGCADPFSRRVLRVSMGTALRLPILECPRLDATLQRLRTEYGVQTLATVLDADAEPLTAVRRAPRIALLFGNEADGLAPQWLELCDRRITIPMQPGTDSLNVAVAAGIFLYHLCDQ